MPFDLPTIRAQFPALAGSSTIFLDNPGGTQITRRSLDRISDYLVRCNANHGGAFATSIESDHILHQAHQAMADLLNAPRPEEIVFGPNMTTLTFSISRALAKTVFQPGDTIVVTHLDHDANVMPWVLAAEDRGCRVRRVDFHPEDCTLDLEDFAAAMEERPRLVAFGYASNATGTVNPVAQLVKMAHAAGALTYVDAVQYAPHGPIDVQALDCDFLACSAYKFFGPHQGMVYGRYELLDGLKAYKVRPAPDEPPGKFETGTQSHEGMAGTLGAVEYLAWLGEQAGGATDPADRRALLRQGMAAIRDYERTLSQALLDLLSEVPGLTLYGIADPGRLDERGPTCSFTLAGQHPRAIAAALAERGINVWDGNYYALSVTERLGLEETGGMVRVGAAHYNTLEEIERFGEALRSLLH